MDPGYEERSTLAQSHKSRLRKQIYFVFMIVFVLVGDQNPGIDWFVDISGFRAWVALSLLQLYLGVMWFSYRHNAEGGVLLLNNPFGHRWFGIGTLLWALWRYILPPASPDLDQDSRKVWRRAIRDQAQNDLAFFMNNSFPEWVLIAGYIITVLQLIATHDGSLIMEQTPQFGAP